MLIGIDQGTSGTTVCAFDRDLTPLASASRAVAAHPPRDGWVEHDPFAIEASVQQSVREVLEIVSEPIEACGFANQGETVLAWDARSLQPIGNAIVWSDTRGQHCVEDLDADWLRRVTGLRASPYFCAPKYAWLMQNDPRVRDAVAKDRAMLGTLDTWLLRRFGIASDITDESTASRTLLYGLRERSWNPELLSTFGVPRTALARIVPSLGRHGALRHASWKATLPLTATLVDQPAALSGNGCLNSGEAKITYGTGAFFVANRGTERDARAGGLLTSVAWSTSQGVTYAIDGGVFSAGAAVDWAVARGIAKNADHLDALARQAEAGGPVFVPALCGLGAPWWNSAARAAFRGPDSATPAQQAAAVLDGIALRVADILRAYRSAGYALPAVLGADGGLSRSAYLMQRQADVAGCTIEAADNPEATARGAAGLAALANGIDVRAALQHRGPVRRYEPAWLPAQREASYARWRAALEAIF